MTAELDKWVKKHKIAVFHWAFDFFGGGEKVAIDIARCLGLKKVYTLFSEAEKDGVKTEDISYLLPRWTRFFGKITKKRRALEYWVWEMVDVTELDDFDIIITSGVTPRAIITQEHIMHVNYCLDEDTKILVRDNGFYRILPIKDVEVGMEVLSFDENGKIVFNKVLAKRYTGYREDMLRVRVRGGREVVCTSDHKFYVYNKLKKTFEIVEAKDLRENIHFIPILRRIPEPESHITEINIPDELRKSWNEPDVKDRVFVSLDGSYITMGNLGNKTPKVPSKVKVTRDLAELIGYYIAEGCQHRSSKNRLSFDVFITFGHHEPHLAEKVKNLSKSCFKFEPKIQVHRHGHCIQVRFPNVFGVVFRYVFGLGRRSLDQRIPDWILNIPRDCREALLRAYLEGDGHYYPDKNQYQCNTSSYDLVDGLVTLATSLGWWITVVKRQYWKDKSIVYHMVLKDDEKYLPNTLPKYERIIPFKGDIVLSPVISVSKESGRHTYDLEVSGNHLFATAQGMVVHNCHSVPRWLWDLWHFRWKLSKKSFRIFSLTEVFRWMDIIADSRVDYYFVNSELIKRRLWKYMKRDSVVLYPPIETKKYRFEEFGDFVLHMGRFDVEKQIMPVVKACERAGVKLILTGNAGNDKVTFRYVQKHNGNGIIDYRGFVSEEEKLELLARCKAVIYNPLNEDYGIIPSEALASGKPVIVNHTGYPPLLIKRTGFRESDGVLKIYNGGIVTKGDESTIATAIKLLDRYEWDSEFMMNFAKRFDIEVFRTNLIFQLMLWKKQFDRMLEGDDHAL